MGFVTTMTDPVGFRQDDYDVAGRTARTARQLDGLTYTAAYTYNSADLITSTTYPDGDTISWSYDGAGNLETETGTVVSSTYDAAGRLRSRNFTNGITTEVDFSPTRGWVENIHTFKNGVTHQDLVYGYYPDGMIQSIASPKPKESWSYTYDDLHRLSLAVNVDTPALSQSFTYDSIGNVL